MDEDNNGCINAIIIDLNTVTVEQANAICNYDSFLQLAIWPSQAFLKGNVTTLYNYNTQAQLPRRRKGGGRKPKKGGICLTALLPSCLDLPEAAASAVKNLKKWRGDNGDRTREGQRLRSTRCSPSHRALHMQS